MKGFLLNTIWLLLCEMSFIRVRIGANESFHSYPAVIFPFMLNEFTSVPLEMINVHLRVVCATFFYYWFVLRIADCSLTVND